MTKYFKTASKGLFGTASMFTGASFLRAGTIKRRDSGEQNTTPNSPLITKISHGYQHSGDAHLMLAKSIISGIRGFWLK